MQANRFDKKCKRQTFLNESISSNSDRLRLLIKERDSRKIDIRVVFRTDKLNDEEMSFLQELTSVKVSSCDKLHAKCYLNEKTAIITSKLVPTFAAKSQQANISNGNGFVFAVDVI